MGVFDGYEKEALLDLVVTLRNLSDGSVDEGDLIVLRDFIHELADNHIDFVGNIEAKGQELVGEYLQLWYVKSALLMLSAEIEKKINED